MKHFRILYRYFIHWVTARNTKGYGVHSPFLFYFVRTVLRETAGYYAFDVIEGLRNRLLVDKSLVRIKDFGTGKDREETIAQIASKSLCSPLEGQLLFRMVNYFKPKVILELGTSLGISTAYMASVNSNSLCYSLEGSSSLVSKAAEHLKLLRLNNVVQVEGNITENLETVLSELAAVDFVYVDANHQYDAVVDYFEKCLLKSHEETVFVLDDIYWSQGMEKAWEYVKNHPSVVSTIDVFYFGIVFLKKDLPPKHYRVRC